MAEENAEGKAVRIELQVPQDLPSLYATNMVVQHTPYEFIVKCWTDQPTRFKLNPTHYFVGLNI